MQSSYTSVLVPGKIGQPRPPLPLEILPLGQFDPVYRSPLDVQVWVGKCGESGLSLSSH